MSNFKYLSKETVYVNNNLKIIKYFYKWGVTTWYVPKSIDEEVVRVHINYPMPIKTPDELVSVGTLTTRG